MNPKSPSLSDDKKLLSQKADNNKHSLENFTMNGKNANHFIDSGSVVTTSTTPNREDAMMLQQKCKESSTEQQKRSARQSQRSSERKQGTAGSSTSRRRSNNSQATSPMPPAPGAYAVEGLSERTSDDYIQEEEKQSDEEEYRRQQQQQLQQQGDIESNHDNDMCPIATATMVTSDMADGVRCQGEIAESERAHIREKAKADVEAKLMSKVVMATDTNNNKSNKSNSSNKKFYVCLAVSLFILTVAIVVGVVLLKKKDNDNDTTDNMVGSGDSNNNNQTPTVSPPSPTNNDNYGSPPPPEVPIIAGNIFCQDAFDIATNATILGSNVDVMTTNYFATCQGIRQNGLGVWLHLKGTGSRVVASTCNYYVGPNTLDTQISIYSGESCDALFCTAGNDQWCGDQSQVAWFAETDVSYYIFVHGFRSRTGEFLLSTSTLEDNSKCSDAIEFAFPTEVPIFGTTRTSTESSSPSLYQNGVSACGLARESDTPGAWYVFESTLAESVLIHVDSKETFDFQVSVWTGTSCDDLTCVSGTYDDSTLQFDPQGDGIRYYVFITGIDNQQGDFELNVDFQLIGGDNDDVLMPSGCESSPFLDSFQAGITRGSRFYDYLGTCGNEVFFTSQATWYQLKGTGLPMMLSTCGSELDTQISVFRGPCDSLQCIDGNDEGECGNGGSELSFFTEANSQYFVVVHGYADRKGTFNITLTEAEIETSNKCDSAITLEVNGLSILGTLEAKAPPSQPNDVVVDDGTDNMITISLPRNNGNPNNDDFKGKVCGDSLADPPASWFKVIGTGQFVTASLCHDGTTLASSTITVLKNGESKTESSCDKLECELKAIKTPCGSHESVTWNSIEGITYWIVVQGYTHIKGGDDDVGKFVLVVEETVNNSICQNAVGPLALTNVQSYFGSTRSATIDYNIDRSSCAVGDNDIVSGGFVVTTTSSALDEGDVPAGRGVWYTVAGDGNTLTASTCSEYTNFDTIIRVYIKKSNAQHCDSNLECVPVIVSPTNDCGKANVISWDSKIDELYYILVEGDTPDDFGSFELSIGIENDFCESATGLSNTDATAVAGTTRGASTNDNLPFCTGGPTSGYPGVWYWVRGNGSFLTVSVCQEGKPNFEAQIGVFTGSCSNLDCAIAQDSLGLDVGCSHSWQSVLGVQYFVVVYGAGVGDFELTVAKGNQVCTSPEKVHGASNSYAGSLSVPNFPTVGEIDPCTTLSRSFGAWYAIEGTGDALEVTLCTSPSKVFGVNAQAQLTVFQGDCRVDLQCVDDNSLQEQKLDDASCQSIVITTEAKRRYFIFVHHDESAEPGDQINYELSIQEPGNNNDDNNNNHCQTALDIGTIPPNPEFGGNTVSVDATIYNDDNVATKIDCTSSAPVQNGSTGGVWFQISGNGTTKTVVACGGGKSFDLYMVVFSNNVGDCESLQCTPVEFIDPTSTGSCGGKSIGLTFATAKETTYYVMVFSDASVSAAAFSLLVT